MRVFVTGAGGFVGRRLVARLRDDGHTVEAADLELDVTQAGPLAAAFEQFAADAVVHLAAVSSVAASWRDPAVCFRVNYLGTRSLLEAVERGVPGARVLLIGSADQYGTTPAGAAIADESTPLRPVSPYARSKAAAEQLGSLAALRGCDVVRVRAFTHTGPGQADVFVASSFARQIAEISLGRAEAHLRVGNLDSVRDFLHVDDVIEAYSKLLDPGVPADVYNVASGSGVAIRDVLDQLLALGGVEARIEVDADRYRPTDQLIGDAARLRAASGWAPTISLRDTLSALLEDWRSRLLRQSSESTVG